MADEETTTVVCSGSNRPTVVQERLPDGTVVSERILVGFDVGQPEGNAIDKVDDLFTLEPWQRKLVERFCIPKPASAPPSTTSTRSCFAASSTSKCGHRSAATSVARPRRSARRS